MTLTLPSMEYEDIDNLKLPSHHRMKREFIAWDGEGIRMEESPTIFDLGGVRMFSNDPEGERDSFFEYVHETQPYVLLANSKGERIVSDENGLSTVDCFEFMLNAKTRHPNSIFIGFGINYDINQMLKDLRTENLWRLHDKNSTYWRSYRIKWLPGKSLTVSQRSSARSFIIYDVFGFFQSSFLSACKKYLGGDMDLELIEKGKAAREAFTYDELDDFIIPYNGMELQLLVKMMDLLRDDLESVGIMPSLWHGPGAIASEVLKHWSIPITRSIPNEVLDASQYAYAGGRFEHFHVGRYNNTVYEYDIRSAYPAGATHLPNLSEGVWEYVTRFEPGTFGVWHLNYRSRQRRKGLRPEPLFCRSQQGNVSFPCAVQGWYWTPEAALCPDSVIEGWVFRPLTDERPFSFIKDLYEERRLFKVQKNSAERALKLILNSIYGKLAQTVGWSHEGPPRWHQLEYAGYITSYTRAKIYNAMLLAPDKIIAVETDAVFSGVPLDLPLSDELGDWEVKEYTSITYLQSGYYYAIEHDGSIVCKYRGMDRDRETMQPVGLPYGTVLDHLHDRTGPNYKHTPPLHSSTTRFVGLGLGLRTSATWRAWEKVAKSVSIDQDPRSSKRFHLAERCSACQKGYNMFDYVHPMMIGGYSGKSYARNIPWRLLDDSTPLDETEWLEINPEKRDFGEDLARWQTQ